MTAIPRDYVDAVCKPGQQEATCAFLLFSPEGWACAKNLPDIQVQVQRRLLAGTMVAKGDNCDGWDPAAEG